MLCRRTRRAGAHPPARNARRNQRQHRAHTACARSQRLKNLGLLGPNLIAVHAVHLTRRKSPCSREHGCHVAHCPTSNLKLASGIAPLHALLAGRRQRRPRHRRRRQQQPPRHVCRKCASPRCSPRAAAAMPTALPAHAALEMATHRRARARSAWTTASARSYRQARRHHCGRISAHWNCRPVTTRCRTWSMLPAASTSATSGSTANARVADGRLLEPR